MGDIITGQTLQNASSNQEVVSAINDASAGVHDVVINLETLEKKYYEKATPALTSIKNSLTSILEDLSDLVTGLSIEKSETDKEKATKPAQVNKSMTLDNILKYNDSVAASTVLIIAELQAIKSILTDNKKSDNSDAGGVGKIFKGLGAGAAGLVILAGSLVLFAAAAHLFAGLQWKPALAGLGMFALFVVGSLAIAKILGPEQKTLKRFAISVMAMTAAFGLFSLTIWLVSKIGNDFNWSAIFTTLGAFAGFSLAVVLLAKLVGKEQKTFAQFTLSIISMTFALALFSGALVLVDYLSDYIEWKKVIPTMAAFGVFALATIALSHLVSGEGASFVKFASSVSIMALAMGLFAGVLVLITFLGKKIEWNVVIPTMAAFGVFALATVVLSDLLGPRSNQFLDFTKSIMLMAVAMGLFSGVLALVSFIGKFIDWKTVEYTMAAFGIFALATVALSNLLGPEANNFKKFVESIALMTLAMGLFAGVLVVISIIEKYVNWDSVVKTMGLFGIFALATVALSKLLGPEKSGFQKFVESITLMSLALGLFSGVLVVISFIEKYINWDSVVKTMELFGIFALATVALSKLLGPEKSSFQKFVDSIALMSLALGLFAGVTVLISFLNNYIKWPVVEQTMVAFGVFALAAIGLSKLMGPETGNFKKFIESVTLLSLSLGLFAGIVVLISFLDKYIKWPIVEQTMLAFGVFALAVIGISKIIGPEKGNFKKFVESIALMSLALGLFAGVVVLISFLNDYIKWSVVEQTMLTFGVVALTTIGISKLMSPETGNFKKFVESVTLMSLALGLFAGVLVLISFIEQYIDWRNVEITMTTFGVFALATIGISKLIGPEKSNFKKFIESVTLMSLALGLFAGVVVLISFIEQYIDWHNVEITMAAFGVFALATVALTKIVGPEKGNFKKFIESVTLMSLALGLFAGVVVLISFIEKYIDWHNVEITMAAFGVFALATVALAKIVGPEENSLNKFIASVSLMSLALGLFGGVVALISYVGKDIDWNIVTPTMAAFGVFALASVVLAKLVGDEESSFIKLAAGIGAMDLAFGLFAGVLYLISSLGDDIDMPKVLEILGMFGGFVLASVVLAKLADSAIADIMLLAAAAGVMSLVFAEFAGALKICEMLQVDSLLYCIEVLGIMLVFIGAVSALGALMSLAAAPILVGLGLMAGVTTALLVMAGELYLTVTALNAVEITDKTIENVSGISQLIDAVSKIKFGEAVKAAAEMVPLVGFMTGLALVAVEFTSVVKNLNQITDTQDELSAKIKKLTDAINVLTSMELHPLAIGKMTIGLGELVIAILALGGVLLEFIALSKLKYDEEAILRVLGTINILVDTVGSYGEKIQNIGVKAAKALSIALDGITKAMNNITDIILKIKDIPINEIDIAVANIKYMMSKLFISSGNIDDPTMVDVLESMPGISKRAANASQSLPAITEALKNITDVIIQIKDVPPDLVAQAIESIKIEVACLRDCSGMFAEIAGDSTVGHLWWKKDTFAEAGKTIDNISNLIPKIKAIFEDLGTGSFSTEGIDSLRVGVQTISGIDKSFKSGADYLLDGFNKIDKISGKGLEKIESSIKGLNVSPLDQLGSSISKFISNSSGLDKVVKNLEDLSSALKDVAKSSKDIKGFDFSKAAKASSAKESPSARIADQQVTVSGKTDNEKMIDLMRQTAEFVKTIVQYSQLWSTDGMPVVQITEGKDKKNPFDFFGK